MSTEPLDRAPAPTPEMDEETHALVQELFGLVRAGDTERLARLLEMGLVPNLRDGKGNSLLMLASYHEHPGTTRLLLEHGADPALRTDEGVTARSLAESMGAGAAAARLARPAG